MMRVARSAIVIAALWLAAPCTATPAIGEVALPFAARLLDGRMVRSADLAGKVVILNYWATWCAPCRAELADLDVLAARLGPAVQVIAIDAGRATEPRLLERQRQRMTIPIATALTAGAADYGPIRSAVPSTYVIDRRGRLVFARAGVLAAGELSAIVDPLIAASASPRP